MTAAHPTFYLKSLGCKTNYCDGLILRDQLVARGLREVVSPADATLIIVNSCAVTSHAEVKARKLLRSLQRQYPQARIVLTGCMIELPDIRSAGDQPILLHRRDEKGRSRFITTLTGSVEPPAHTEIAPKPRTRGFIKIQDGCSRRCTYCIVSLIRGPLYSKPIAEVVAEVNAFEASGHKEVVLTGIHIGLYGKDTSDPEDMSLVALLRALVAETHIPRIRLSSIEINELDDELVALLASEPRICPHLHIPLQSGDEEVLQAMGRLYAPEFFIKTTERLYASIPDLAITGDVITGFPGESESAFMHTCELVKDVGFGRLHVFPFSPRPGTPAASMPEQVEPSDVHDRARRLIAIGQELSRRFHERHLGRVMEVLIEGSQDLNGVRRGFTSNYIRVMVGSTDNTHFNTISSVKIEEIDRFGRVHGSPVMQ